MTQTYQVKVAELEGEKRALEDRILQKEGEKAEMQSDLQSFQGEIG